jgi:hypothetical protein
VTSSRVMSPPRSGFRRWYALFAGIAWWMLHITASAALSGATCPHPQVRWAMHGLTLFTALATLVAIGWSAALYREGRGSPQDAVTVAGRDRFLGAFGLLTGAVSLLLILWEGAYVLFLSGCR